MNDRMYKLLELLSINDEFVPMKYFANRLNVSVRTIQNDIETIKNNFSGEIEIATKTGKGIKLNKYNRRSMKTQHDPVYLRRKYIIDQILVNNKIVTLKKLAEDFYVSETSIIADLDYIDRKIIAKGGAIKSTHNGTEIIGCEISRQKSLLEFNRWVMSNEIVARNLSSVVMKKALTDLYGETIVNACYRIVYDHIKNSVNKLGEYNIFNVINILTIMVYRKALSYSITDEQHVKETFFGDAISNARKILKQISTRFKLNFSQVEVNYLAGELVANRLNDYSGDDNKWIEIMRKITRELSVSLNIDIVEDQILKTNIENHVPPMIYRLQKGVSTTNPFTEQIMQEYPIVFNYLSLLLAKYEGELETIFTVDEIAFLTLHYEAAIERAREVSKIVVICPTGIATAELLVNKLINILPRFVNVQVASMRELYEIDSDTDLIISTVHIPESEHEIIEVSNFLTNKDVENIVNRFNKKQNKLIKSINSKKELKKIINSDFIFINQNCISIKDCLDEPLKQLIKFGYVKEGFEESVLNREKMGGTNLNNGVAIPHGNPKLVNKTVVSLIVCEDTFKWNENDVDIVFLLAVAEKDVQNIKSIIQELYSIINEQKLLKNIRNSKRPNDILELL